MSKKIDKMVEAAKAFEEGRSIAWVAREFGYSHLQAGYIVALLGLKGKRRDPTARSLDKYDQVERALEEKWPIGEITKTFKVDRWTVDRWFPNREKMTPREAGELAQLYQLNREAQEKLKSRNEWAFRRAK